MLVQFYRMIHNEKKSDIRSGVRGVTTKSHIIAGEQSMSTEGFHKS